jgi:hypothetical protein
LPYVKKKRFVWKELRHVILEDHIVNYDGELLEVDIGIKYTMLSCYCVSIDFVHAFYLFMDEMVIMKCIDEMKNFFRDTLMLQFTIYESIMAHLSWTLTFPYISLIDGKNRTSLHL